MSTVQYSAMSPYASTDQTNWYLDVMNARSIPADVSDTTMVLDSRFNLRPDTLSQQLYGTPAYWWVFMMRNLDVIRDPIWDFKTGITIYVPTNARLRTLLG